MLNYITHFTAINNPNAFAVLLIIAAVLLFFAGKDDN